MSHRLVQNSTSYRYCTYLVKRLNIFARLDPSARVVHYPRFELPVVNLKGGIKKDLCFAVKGELRGLLKIKEKDLTTGNQPQSIVERVLER